ncbi:condensation domain-containing protein, partial [Pseudoalteromonas sp. Of7M-16]|uniref:condensation domain-containing protein n=1 Tax=Pseudoalteromonas sp. Of7M-16 TaxID=2917756 RepID=UPI001EF56C20
ADSLRVLYVHSETRQALILIAHHLVIDGVSWRILVDDLLQGIEQAAAGKSIALALKSHSYQYWAQQIQTYPSSHQSEFELWQNQHSDALALPNFVAEGDDTMHSAQTIQVALSEEQTQALLSQAQRPYRTHIDELLLASLSVALKQWTGSNEAQVFLEGHGREPWQSQLDLSRTLGWFTALYPVKLTSHHEIADTIIATKERLRAVGSSIAAQNPLSADIAINGAIQNGVLNLAITYSGACLEQSDMAEFAQRLEQALTQVIAHCSDANTRLTPADVPLLSLSQTELDALPIAQQTVSSIYPLSAMQQGMMFHSMVEQSAAYLNQLRLDISRLSSWPTQF